MSAEFLAYLDREAAARVAARRARRVSMAPCRICKGSGSVPRYVLPGIVGPDKCKSCNGSGDAAPAPTVDQGPPIQVHCPDCGAVPGNACRSPKSGGFVGRPHAARKKLARELFGDGVDT